MICYFPRALPYIVSFLLVNKSTGEPITAGPLTIKVTKDSGAQVDATNTPLHNGNGEWILVLTAAERDADKTSLTILHGSALPKHISIKSDN